MAAMGTAQAPAQMCTRERSMPIRTLAAAAAYTPEQLTSLIHAYESACAALGIARSELAAAEAVALKILEYAGTGELDPDRLRDCAVHALRRHDGGSS